MGLIEAIEEGEQAGARLEAALTMGSRPTEPSRSLERLEEAWRAWQQAGREVCERAALTDRAWLAWNVYDRQAKTEGTPWLGRLKQRPWAIASRRWLQADAAFRLPVKQTRQMHVQELTARAVRDIAAKEAVWQTAVEQVHICLARRDAAECVPPARRDLREAAKSVAVCEDEWLMAFRSGIERQESARFVRIIKELRRDHEIVTAAALDRRLSPQGVPYAWRSDGQPRFNPPRPQSLIERFPAGWDRPLSGPPQVLIKDASQLVPTHDWLVHAHR